MVTQVWAFFYTCWKNRIYSVVLGIISGALGGIALAQPQYRLYGLDFSPYLDGQAPGSQISAAQIQTRLAVVAPYTEWVRTYSSLNGIEQTCPIAHQMGLKCAAGASIYGSATDAQEISGLISLAQAGFVDLAIVGTEALFRGNVSAQTLVDYVNQVKAAAPGVPVTTADTYGALLNNSSVLSAVDVVLFNIYPYWEGVSLDDAVGYINGWYQLVSQAAGGKQVIVSETGWPSGGGNIGSAIATPVNSSSYFLDFISWARANNIAYFYFEAFDESWKVSENPQGPYFGVFDKTGILKAGMAAVFNGTVVQDNWSGNNIPGGPGTPTISLTYVPAMGSTANLYGQVLHLRPADYKVACYIRVASWYIKPYAAQPLTPIFPDGTWRCSPASTGDTFETALAALVFPNGYSPPWQVPDVSSLGATASVIVNRTQYGIAGVIRDNQGVELDGVSVALSGAQVENTQTTNGGQYSFVDLNSTGSYVITPSAPSAVFSPSSQSYTTLTGIQTANFTATSRLLVISGQVSDTSGNAVSGVSLSLSGTVNGTGVTTLFGDYLFDSLPPQGSYTITPSLNGYTFNPPSQSFNSLSGDQTANFVANTGSSTALSFVPITPCRVADTRNSPNGPFAGPAIAAGTSRDFAIPDGSCGVPITAQAYSMNIAVVPQGRLGFLTVWPAGQAQPTVATLNSWDGRVKSNGAIIPAGTGGAISVFATGTTNVVLDINGYFVSAVNNPAAMAYYPLTPCRVLDTRNPNGPLGGPYLPGNTTRDFPVLSATCGISPSAQAYSLNVAVVPHGSMMRWLTAWPSGQSQPMVTTLNDRTGTVLSNGAIVPAGSAGQISIYVTDDTDVVVDINAYFAPPAAGGLSLYTIQPCRVLDTRLPAGSAPFSGTRDVDVVGSGCGAPATAQAYVFNATVVPPGVMRWMTLWPEGTSQPLISSLNDKDGTVTNNLALVPTTNGSINAFVTDPTFLILDMFGYFAP